MNDLNAAYDRLEASWAKAIKLAVKMGPEHEIKVRQLYLEALDRVRVQLQSITK